MGSKAPARGFASQNEAARRATQKDQALSAQRSRAATAARRAAPAAAAAERAQAEATRSAYFRDKAPGEARDPRNTRLCRNSDSNAEWCAGWIYGTENNNV